MNMHDAPQMEGDDRLEADLRGFRAELTPPDRAPGWPPRADIHYDIAELAIGRMMIATRGDGTLLSSIFLRQPDPATEERAIARLARAMSPAMLRGGPGPATVLRQLEEYLAGRRRRFDLELDSSLTSSFQRLILGRLVADVGYGQTTSYGALAAAADRSGAARAVGSALGANPLCVVVPCHRVLAGSGNLNGYAGGPEAKRFLLDLEREQLEREHAGAGD